MSVFDLYNSGYKNILLSFQATGEYLQLINTRPFNDAEIDSIRSNCVMDNNPQKVASLHIKTGGYIHISTFNEQEELVRGENIDIKTVELVRLCHRNFGFDSKDDEIIGIYIPINNKALILGSKIHLNGKAWEVVGKRQFNKYEIDYVQSACVTNNKPDKYVLFFKKDGSQYKIPLSRAGVDCPIGSSIDLKKANLVTYYREGDGNFLLVEVNEINNEISDIDSDKKLKERCTQDIETGANDVEPKESNGCAFWKNAKIMELLYEIIWIFLGLFVCIIIAKFIFNGCSF